jgi:hypothetical protein
VLGEMMNAGVSRLTWWIGFGNCNGANGNLSTSLYGWQDFGAYNVFSDGPDEDPTCPGAGPLGTMSPTARAFQLFSKMAVNGQTALTTTVVGDPADVRAYAATNPSGTAVLLFNDNENLAQPVTVTVSGKSSSSGVTVVGLADRNSAGRSRDEHLGSAQYHQHGRTGAAGDPDPHSVEHERSDHSII